MKIFGTRWYEYLYHPQCFVRFTSATVTRFTFTCAQQIRILGMLFALYDLYGEMLAASASKPKLQKRGSPVPMSLDHGTELSIKAL